MSVRRRSSLSSVRLVLASLTMTFAFPVVATTTDFEGFADSTALTNQIAGLTFADSTVITAGLSLNEFEFPPHSGSNVVFDDGGPMHIVFDSLQASVGGFFTYSAPLELVAFDSSNNLLGSVASAFSSNLALSGDPGSAPNEFLSMAFGGIKSVTITGNLSGSSFALDDLTFTPATVSEPPILLLILLGLSLFRGSCLISELCEPK